MKIGEMNLSFQGLEADVRLTNIEVGCEELKDILATVEQLSTDNKETVALQGETSEEETKKLLIRERIAKIGVEKVQAETAKLQVEERIKHMGTQKHS